MTARRISSLTLGVVLLATLLVSWPSRANAWNGIQAWTDGFEDANATGWTVNQNGAAVSFDGSTANTGTYSLKITGASGAGQFARLYSRWIRIDFTRDYTVQCAFRYEDFHWDRFLIFGHIRLLLDYPTLPILYDPVGDNSFVGNQICEESFETFLPALRWGWVTVHCRPALQQYDVFINGTHVGTVNYQASVIPSTKLWFEDNGSAANFLDAWYDDFSVWGYHDPALCPFALAVTCADPPDVENDSTVWAAPPLVPYHGQYWHQLGHPLNEPCSPPRGANGNGRCFCACLHMLFDRFGDNLPLAGAPNRPGPQEEIEAAANTNDRVNCPNGSWHGTTLTDIRRGAHFSGAAVPAAPTVVRNGCPPAGCPQVGGGPAGYSWRDLGYAAVESVWTDLAPEDAGAMDLGLPPLTLETMLASGYPIIALITAPNGYCDSLKTSDKDCEVVIEDDQVDGHAVVIGYDNTGAGGCEPYANHLGRAAFMVHDPAVGKFAWVDMQWFWDNVWTSKRFLFAAPWELMWLSPPEWCYNANFDGTLLSIYPGPPPLDGFCTVCRPKAKLTLTAIGRPDDEVLTHNLNNTNATGDWDFTAWALKAPARLQGAGMVGTIKYTAWARLCPGPLSTSYPGGYKDNLGNEGRLTKQISMCLTASGVDPGHFGWPYSDRWWHRTGGGSGLRLVAQGGPSHEVFATIGNNGGEPIPPGTILRLFWEDPGASTRSPGVEYIAEIELPPLEYGDTLTVGPIPWTAPPYNSFGEPYFTILSEIDCPEDPVASEWPQAENNVAVLSDFYFENDPGEPAVMTFWVENPEPTGMEMVLEIEKEEAAAGWEAELSMPVGEPFTLGPLEAIPVDIIVTPWEGPPSVGCVHIDCFLYYPGGELVRQTGGITMDVRLTQWGDVADESTSRPSFALEQSRPNPLGPRSETVIHFATPRDGQVDLRIYEVSGRLVRTLISDQLPGRQHVVTWHGLDDRGHAAPNGVYFYRLQLDRTLERTRQLIVLR